MSEYLLIKEDYSLFNLAIESIMMDPAFESSNDTNDNDSIDNSDKKINLENSILEKIKALIDKILQAIDTALLKLKNSFQKIYLTDKGFQRELKEWKKSYQPLKSIKLIAYQYNPTKLSNVITKVTESSNTYIRAFDSNKIEEENNPLNQDLDTIMKDIVSKSGLEKSSDIEDGTGFLNEVKKDFRGDKGSYTFSSNHLNGYISATTQYSNIETKINSLMSNSKASLLRAKETAKRYATNNNISDDLKRKMNTQLSKIASIYNFYISFLRLSFELEVEYMLTCRAIIRKFYQQ